MPRNRTIRERVSFALDIIRGIAEPSLPRNTKKSPYVSSFNYNMTPQRSLLDYQTFYEEGFEENPLIYSAVMVKAKGITQAKLTAYKYLDEKRKKYEEIPYIENLPKLLKRPNYYQSNDEFFSLQDVFLNLTGNSFTYLERKSKNSEVAALWPLNPVGVFIIPDDKGEIKGYEYEPQWAAGEKFPIEVQNMAHVKLPNPNDPLNGLGFGLSPIMPMAMTGDVDNMITKFLNVFFKHGAMPPGILKFKDMALDENEMSEIREKWKEIYGGYTNWSDIGVLDAHGEYQRIGLTFEEMNFEKLDQRNETRILASLGVPIELLPNVSALTGSTYANKKEARTMFWEDTMMFELEMFEQEFNRVLFNQDLETDVFVKWDTSEVPALKREMVSQVDSAVKLIEKGVPPQVAFNTVGLDVEEYDGIDKPFAQPAPSFQEVQQANKERFAEQSENNPFSKKPTDENELEKETDEAKNNSFLAQKNLSKTNSSYTIEQKKQIYEDFDQIAINHEQEFGDKASELFEIDRRNILSIITGEKKKALQTKSSIKWDNTLAPVDEYLFSVSKPNWRSEFTPMIAGVYSDVGNYWSNQLGIAFNIRNIEGEFALQKYTLKFSDFITKTSSNEVKGVISQGFEEGWSIDEMTNNLDQLFTQWTKGTLAPEDFQWMKQRSPIWRRELIARTETTRAANTGARELYERWGSKEKEWLSTMDDRTRDTHKSLNGQIVDIKEPFVTSFGNKLMQPGDSNAPLSETAACRCTVLPVIPKTKDLKDINPTPISFDGMTNEQISEVSKNIFGKENVTREDIAKYLGVNDSDLLSNVKMSIRKMDNKSLEVQISSDQIKSMLRYIQKQGNGFSVENNYFYLNSEYQSRGIGGKIFSNQVKELLNTNAKFIKTEAKGKFGDEYNGYYTWARLGYNAPLSQSIRKRLPDELKNSSMVSDLMKSEIGRKWWLENGRTINMKFDLDPTSTAVRVLTEYAKRKGYW